MGIVFVEAYKQVPWLQNMNTEIVIGVSFNSKHDRLCWRDVANVAICRDLMGTYLTYCMVIACPTSSTATVVWMLAMTASTRLTLLAIHSCNLQHREGIGIGHGRRLL